MPRKNILTTNSHRSRPLPSFCIPSPKCGVEGSDASLWEVESGGLEPAPTATMGCARISSQKHGSSLWRRQAAQGSSPGSEGMLLGLVSGHVAGLMSSTPGFPR